MAISQKTKDRIVDIWIPVLVSFLLPSLGALLLLPSAAPLRVALGPVVSKFQLLVAIALLLLGLGLSISYNLHLRRKLQAVQKPKHLLAAGIYWDDLDKPLCPVCIIPLYYIQPMGGTQFQIHYKCPQCKTVFLLKTQSNFQDIDPGYLTRYLSEQRWQQLNPPRHFPELPMPPLKERIKHWLGRK